jgi:hypothetical protein
MDKRYIPYIELDEYITQNTGAIIKHMKEDWLVHESINHLVDLNPIGWFIKIIRKILV